MAALSRKDVEHVAFLARLGLTEEELTRLEGQMNHILDQYAVLAQLDTEDRADSTDDRAQRRSCATTWSSPGGRPEALANPLPNESATTSSVPPILGEHGR